MSSATVRISPRSHQTLRSLSKLTGDSLQAVLDRAIEEERRRLFFDKLDAGYAAINNDPAAKREFDRERDEWDVTLKDGLEDANGRKRKPRRRLAGRS